MMSLPLTPSHTPHCRSAMAQPARSLFPNQTATFVMTNTDCLVSIFSRMEMDTVGNFMTKPMHYENPPKSHSETEGREQQVCLSGELMTHQNQQATMQTLQNSVSAEFDMAPEESKEKAAPINNGGIRAVSKLFRLIFDKFARKKFTIKTFRAYNKKSLSLMENVVYLKLPSYSPEGLLSPNMLDFTAWVHMLEARQLRSLSVLKVNPHSIYDVVAKSDFIRSTVPGLDVLAAEEGRPLFSLDVFSACFTVLDCGQFWSSEVLTGLVKTGVSERNPGDNTIIGLMERCRTLELNCTSNLYDAICVMKLASSAKTVRFNNTPSGVGHVSNETKDRILNVFGNGVDGVGEHGILLSNFERLELEHHGSRVMPMQLWSALCTGGLFGRLPLLSGVREVCISGPPSMNYCNCMMMTSVRKLEFRNLSVLMTVSPEHDLDEDVDLDRRFLEPDIFLKSKGERIAKIACTCFPNIEVISVSLAPDEEAEVLKHLAGHDLSFLGAILEKLHEFTWCKDKLELHLSKGLVAMAGLSIMPEDMEVYNRNRCFVVGQSHGDEGDFQLQLTLGSPCCTRSKVVCKCEFEGGATSCCLYLRCRVCSLQNEPDRDLGYQY